MFRFIINLLSNPNTLCFFEGLSTGAFWNLSQISTYACATIASKLSMLHGQTLR